MYSYLSFSYQFPSHVRESKNWKFCLWKPQFSKNALAECRLLGLESGIQLKKSGILLMIGFQTPSSIDGDWNPIPWIRNPRRWIQNQASRLFWIPFWWGDQFSCELGLNFSFSRLVAILPDRNNQKWRCSIEKTFNCHLQNIDTSSSLVSTDSKVNENNVKHEHKYCKWTVIFNFSETAMNNNALINGAKRLGIPNFLKWSCRQLWLRVPKLLKTRKRKQSKMLAVHKLVLAFLTFSPSGKRVFQIFEFSFS